MIDLPQSDKLATCCSQGFAAFLAFVQGFAAFLAFGSCVPWEGTSLLPIDIRKINGMRLLKLLFLHGFDLNLCAH